MLGGHGYWLWVAASGARQGSSFVSASGKEKNVNLHKAQKSPFDGLRSPMHVFRQAAGRFLLSMVCSTMAKVPDDALACVLLSGPFAVSHVPATRFRFLPT